MKTYALIVAAGRAVRFGGAVPKQFREVGGRPLLSWTVSRFEKASSIDGIVVVVSDEHLLFTSQKVIDPYSFTKVQKIVVGGETRQESVLRGLKSLPISTKLVAIHDGARPLTRPSDIDRVVQTAKSERAAMLAIPATDTVKRVRDGYILGTLERDSLYLAQTPQVFDYDLILEAHKSASAGLSVSDDAALIESLGFKVRVVEPTGPNLKVTTVEDLAIVEALVKKEAG